MITLAVANQKGGVGKTTTALTLGEILAEEGRRVLLVDLDPQASLSADVGITANGRSIADVLGAATPGRLGLSAILGEIRKGLDIAPSDISLANCELGLTVRLGREMILKQVLDTARARYDVCLIDCPPSLGLLTINALVAARGVIAPTLPAAADLRGLRLFIDTIEQVRPINPRLTLAGVIISQYDNRLTAHRDSIEVLKTASMPLWLPPVPRSVRVQEAAGVGESIITFAPDNSVSAAYREIAKELGRWLKEVK